MISAQDNSFSESHNAEAGPKTYDGGFKSVTMNNFFEWAFKVPKRFLISAERKEMHE